VLAPTRLEHTAKSRRQKTDEKDAQRLLEALRGHLLAGNALPSVWVPDLSLRDDREIVRGRLDVSRKMRKVKAQIGMLLKRWNLRRHPELGKGWTLRYRAWLRGLAALPSPLMKGARAQLASLLRQLEFLESEIKVFDSEVARLALCERYERSVQAACSQAGVSTLAAMVFLTEIGDPRRFSNRRQVGAFFGLVPSSAETGKRDECKGHITRQGSPRVRGVLCQAYHAEARTDPQEKARYQRLVRRNPKRRKVAVVAGIRRKVIRLWHAALEAREDSTAAPAHDAKGGKRHFALPAQLREYGRDSLKEKETRIAV